MSLSTTSTCLEVPPREQQCAHGIASFVLGKKEIVLVEGSFIKKYFYSKRSVSLPGSAGGVASCRAGEHPGRCQPSSSWDTGAPQSSTGESPLSACWSHLIWCSSGYSWLSGLQACFAGLCWASHQPTTLSSGLFSIHSWPSFFCAWSCPDLAAELCAWPYCASWGLHGLTFQACTCHSRWQHFAPVYQLHNSAWRPCQTCKSALNPTIRVADEDVK